MGTRMVTGWKNERNGKEIQKKERMQIKHERDEGTKK
jgi:hypothetical protein